MSDKSSQTGPVENIVVKRLIDAPVEWVWKAWTEPEHVKRWWGPAHFTSPTCQIDLRVGGRYIFCMRAPQEMGGQESYTTGTYLKIAPLAQLEYTQSLSDKDGQKINPAAIGMPPDFPEEIRTVVTFKRVRETMTELTVTEYAWPAGQMMVYSIAGLHQSVDKLIDSLA
jgi:uncharacterized protein YndB with AHSA1/START domain